MTQWKARIYLENGVREVWLLYRRPAHGGNLPRQTWVEIEDDLTTEVLSGIEIDLAECSAIPRQPGSNIQGERARADSAV